MTEQYVLLTGAKNNAGDFLIGRQVRDLLAWKRPDRALICYDRWLPLTEEQLETINASSALLLAGGPALQPNMYPGIYPLVEDLSRIKVPIIAMAIGWKSAAGRWQDTRNYPLTDTTLKLLSKMGETGFLSSVRDYHTLNALHARGFDHFLMTGCAALYRREDLGSAFKRTPRKEIKQLSFSPGVSFSNSPELDELNKRLIRMLVAAFPAARLTLVFHHSVDEKTYEASHNPNLKLLKAQHQLIQWLESEHIDYVDISGDAKKMIEHYQQCDLHIGYRVHAHILMSSMSRPSVLIAEDGRGTALKDVLGGLIFNGFLSTKNKKKAIDRLLCRPHTVYDELSCLPDEVVKQLHYEVDNGFPRIGQSRTAIDEHAEVMFDFLRQLP